MKFQSKSFNDGEKGIRKTLDLCVELNELDKGQQSLTDL